MAYGCSTAGKGEEGEQDEDDGRVIGGYADPGLAAPGPWVDWVRVGFGGRGDRGQRTPLSDDDEGGPVAGVAGLGIAKHLELGVAHSLGAAFAREQAAVVGFHQLGGGGVGDLPEAHHLGLGASDGEGAAKAEDAFALLIGTLAGVAGGEGD